MEADGGTALYDAVSRGIQLTDDAAGDAGATRAVVVLSDGEATEGGCLSDLVKMRSTREDEAQISEYCGQFGNGDPVDDNGHAVPLEEVSGESPLKLSTDHDVQIFFVGFGESDVNIGRILAQATGAEYQGSTEKDLAAVIEALSGYF
jgi:hypothetical protein